MPKAGLEPACLAAPPPQDGVSANSTTSAVLSLRAQAIHGNAFLPAATFSEELRAEPACSSAVVAVEQEQAAAGPVDPVAQAVERAAGPAVWPVAAPAGPAADSFVALLR